MSLAPDYLALAEAVMTRRWFCWYGTPSQQWKAMQRASQYTARLP